MTKDLVIVFKDNNGPKKHTMMKNVSIVTNYVILDMIANNPIEED